MGTFRIVSLNLWGGRLWPLLVDWFLLNRDSVDVFCLQEMCSSENRTGWSDGEEKRRALVDMYQRIQELLPNFVPLPAFAKHGRDYQGPVEYQLSRGLAMFVKRRITIDIAGDVMVHGTRGVYDPNASGASNLQFAHLAYGDRKLVVCNFHGLWNGGPKTDTEERVKQSKKARAFLDMLSGQVVVCGDFNLIPDTESMRIFSRGMRNLVLENKITSTRSSHYAKPEKMADYILVTPDVRVAEFAVRKDEVSDHLPLEIVC